MLGLYLFTFPFSQPPLPLSLKKVIVLSLAAISCQWLLSGHSSSKLSLSGFLLCEACVCIAVLAVEFIRGVVLTSLKTSEVQTSRLPRSALYYLSISPSEPRGGRGRVH